MLNLPLAHTALAATLDEAGEAKDAAIFRRLAAGAAEAANGAAANSIPALRGAAGGLRMVEAAFDATRWSSDELVLIEAQRLAGEIVARLALTGGERRNMLRGMEEA